MEEATLTFPQWTYWGEIIEHSLLLLIALAVTLLLIIVSQKRPEMDLRFPIFGWGLVSLSQILVNLQHLLIFPLGIYTALVHHGLLVAGLTLIAWTILKKFIKFDF